MGSAMLHRALDVLVAPSPEALPRQAVSATDTDAAMFIPAQIGLRLGCSINGALGAGGQVDTKLPRGGRRSSPPSPTIWRRRDWWCGAADWDPRVDAAVT